MNFVGCYRTDRQCKLKLKSKRRMKTAKKMSTVKHQHRQTFIICKAVCVFISVWDTGDLNTLWPEHPFLTGVSVLPPVYGCHVLIEFSTYKLASGLTAYQHTLTDTISLSVRKYKRKVIPKICMLDSRTLEMHYVICISKVLEANKVLMIYPDLETD